MQKFEYYVPLIIRLILFSFFFILALGAFGFLDKSFGQTLYHKAIVGLVFLFSAYLLIFAPYKGRYITITDEYLEVPNVVFPPFKNNKIKFSEVVNVKRKVYGTEPEGIEIITVIGKSSGVKIVNYFCHNYSVSWERVKAEDYFEVKKLLSQKLNRRFGL